jgi:tripartite-type tricarboxylate transporter receptor subunit TctC
MKAAFFKQGLEPQTTSPDEFAQLIRNELEQNAAVAKSAGIVPE